MGDYRGSGERGQKLTAVRLELRSQGRTEVNLHEYQARGLLRDAGIPCVASTTLRNVTESNGKKIVEFSFVTFRKYFSHDAHASAE